MGQEVVIVGAGPVGLWTAIQIKKRSPETDIQIYERYTSYKRSHVLKLETRSMLLYAKNARNQAEKEFFQEILDGGLSEAFQQAATGQSNFVRTNDLEKALKDYAHKLGININYEAIESPSQLTKKHPNCTQFIAADGAHSKLREAIMGKNAVKEYPLQYVAEVKYETKGRTGSLSANEQYKTNKLLDGMAFEYIGKEKHGITPVSLRFFIDEASYNAMPEASFKEPLKLNDRRLPSSLARDINTYMNVRQQEAGEDYIQGSEKLSKLTLSLYRAKKFSKTQQKKNWYLVGDAAMGVPYFRSLNAGMIIGSQLGYIVTRDSWSNRTKKRAYNACQPLDIAWEFTSASAKNTILKGYDMICQMNKNIPWEFLKWDASERLNFFQKRHNAFKEDTPDDTDKPSAPKAP